MAVDGRYVHPDGEWLIGFRCVDGAVGPQVSAQGDTLL